MSLADALAAAPTRVRPGPQCTVGQVLDRLDNDDRDALAEQLALRSCDPGYRTNRIVAQVLAASGHKVPIQTVERHRRGDCACD